MPFATVLIVFGSWVLLLVLALTVRGGGEEEEDA